MPTAARPRSPPRGACWRRSGKVYERYGFEPVETPAIEYTDALGKFLPDLDRPNEGVFSFQDDDEQWMALRYDLTAPLARYVAENFDALPKPYRSYRAGYVYRNEKPGPGRFRQFMQFDADTVGLASMAADAEVCMMIADTMEELGIPRGSYIVKVNNRKVLDGVMEAIGIGGEENAGKRLTVLRAIDKLDKFGEDGVRCCSARAARTTAATSPRARGCPTKTASNACCDAAANRDGVIEAKVSAPTHQARHRRTRRDRRSWSRASGYDDDAYPHRSVGRARPRILHRPGVRG